MKKVDMQDVCLVAGVVSSAYGMYLVYAPLAYLTIGVVLIRIGLPRKEVK